MLNGFPLGVEPLNSSGDAVPLPIPINAVKKAYLLGSTPTATSLSLACKDMLAVVKQAAIDGGFRVVSSTLTLSDFTESLCLDITCGTDEASPRYYVAVPTDTASTRYLTLGSYIGDNLATTPTQTFCNYDDLDVATFDTNNVYVGNPTLTVYANASIGLLWFALSWGENMQVINVGTPIPRTDTLALSASYPRYGVTQGGGVGFCYSNRTVNDNGTTPDYTNTVMGALFNSLLTNTTLAAWEMVGGISNATKTFSYSVIPVIPPYMEARGEGYLYQEFDAPASFAPIPTMRGVFIGTEYPNFSTYNYDGNTYAIIRQDFSRKAYESPWTAHTTSVLTPASFTQLTDWSA